MKLVKAGKPNPRVQGYTILIVNKVGVECKKEGQYGKGLFVGTEESEDNQEEETEDFTEELVEEQTLIVVVAHNSLNNMVIAYQC